MKNMNTLSGTNLDEADLTKFASSIEGCGFNVNTITSINVTLFIIL